MADNLFSSMFSDDDDELTFGSEDEQVTSSSNTKSSNNELEFESNDLEFDEGEDLFGGTDSTQSSPELEEEDDKTTKKKIALFSIGLGIVVLIVGAIIANIATKSRQHRTNELNQTYTAEYETQAKEVKTTKKNDENVSINQPAITTDSNQWIEVDLSEPIKFQATISSDFTVTSIKHYAKITNSNNDRCLRTIVTGSISGLTGTYELEVPTDKAQNLKIGSIFAVEYGMSDKGEYKIIGAVHYK